MNVEEGEGKRREEEKKEGERTGRKGRKVTRKVCADIAAGDAIKVAIVD